MGKKKVKGALTLPMGRGMKVSFEKMKLRAMVSTNGQMEEYSKGIGSRIKCMGQEQLLGRMGANLLE